MNIHVHKIHQYKRVKGKNSVMYRCVLPGCSHYVRDIFIVGRIAKCPYCGENFLVTNELARRKTLHCEDCTSRKSAIKPEEVTEFLGEIKDV